MPKLLPASAHRRVPWRNGLGVTDEILLAPHPAEPSNPARFAWRVSIASVSAAAPFSSFPGIDRVLMLVEGAGMLLAFDGGPWQRVDRILDPMSFRGEAAVDCRLIDGPVRDLNVMTDRAVAAATVRVARPGGSAPAPMRGPGLVVAVEGRSRVRCGERSFELDRFDAIRADAGEIVLIERVDGALVAIEVEQR